MGSFLCLLKVSENSWDNSPEGCPFNKWEIKLCLILPGSEKMLMADAVYWNKSLMSFANDGLP